MRKMNKKRIRLDASEDVQEFVKAAGTCDFDIDVLYQRILIDAKSLLGVMSLGLSKELTIQYSGSNNHFENVMKKFAVA